MPWASPSLWFSPFLEWLLVCWSFLPCEKTSPQNSFPFLFCGGDISGHKDKMQAAIKPPNKIWFKVSRECIKLQTFPKYQKTQKESSWNSKEWVLQNKTESVQKNSSSKTYLIAPLKHVRNFFWFLCIQRMKSCNFCINFSSIGVTKKIEKSFREQQHAGICNSVYVLSTLKHPNG